MNVLMVNLPFSGHTNPTLPLATKLVEFGNKVTYVNAPEFREKLNISRQCSPHSSPSRIAKGDLWQKKKYKNYYKLFLRRNSM